ncbi:MAG: hypothetical protein COW18_03715 [Zetaproteobacteria bacterium CG12_big_fil_rev_8_21_14_0_65_54_13]|nr:MAG: hypothetical protein COX55_02295 [Zetaproteobacteria bacterium CG23_combo_of_CG06-09_8_20_14_all_54_7]PIW50325.1 MAG: hypothetical protein COW18_03715 [Zetaproteobacteria bacterium CG12_big_fil_rev_8_21_14_0_65_54_13]PIX55384.1 MAG: hypothetical protein COZ50_03090 [Zetaproteobacteria bacterium CG_4_10_14_3_um_filter_54_28]PJA27121.1 MAG: hypothetical protein CO188_13160 [Zetaproteobacteria bacterium CG_4_9_14_3_um_filter_54_145]
MELKGSAQALAREYPCLKRVALLAIVLIELVCSPLAGTAADAAGKSVIHISITDIQPQKSGSLVILLFDRSGWLDVEKAVRHIEVPVDGRDALEVALTDIPYPATYALQLFRDENANHKLDMHWFPLPGPDEPYGFSNNYKPFAKPDFLKAGFPLYESDMTLRINMRN